MGSVRCKLHKDSYSFQRCLNSAYLLCLRLDTVCHTILVSQRVPFVVTFGFLSQNYGKWPGLRNVTLHLYECSLSSERYPEVVGTLKLYLLRWGQKDILSTCALQSFRKGYVFAGVCLSTGREYPGR